MPTCYTEWTVLPHKPIVRLSDRLWTVEGKMSNGVKRIMTMIRLDDGRVLLHNAVALDESEMAELDAWGEVAGILVPNAFHRMDCRIMQARYPDAKVYAPAGAIKAVAKATPVHGTFADAPQGGSVRVVHLPGVKDREGYVEVQGAGGPSLVFNDMLLNVPPPGFPQELFLSPTGRLSIPRFARWYFVSDKAALKAELTRLSDAGPTCLIPGHGAVLTGAVAEPLRATIELL